MATKTDQRWKRERTKRFRILHRDNFTCRYCGSRPGSDLLEVDHLVPRSRGGSDDDENLVTACKTCNGRKSNCIIFPHDLTEGQCDGDGWFVAQRFGEWSIVFCEDQIGIEKRRYGFIEASRLKDHRLRNHLYEKGWETDVVNDMDRAISFIERIVCTARMEATNGR